MRAVNYYVEEQITRGMLESVLSSTRYPYPVPFTETRAVRAGLASRIQQLSADDARNFNVSALNGLSTANQAALRKLGTIRIRDLFDPKLDQQVRKSGLEPATLEKLRTEVLDNLL